MNLSSRGRSRSWSQAELHALPKDSAPADPQRAGPARSSSSSANPKSLGAQQSQQHGWSHRQQQHMTAVSGVNRALSPEPPTSSSFASPRRLPPQPSPSKPSKPSERHDGLNTSEPYNDVPSAWRPEHRRHRRTASWEAVPAATAEAATTTVSGTRARHTSGSRTVEKEKPQPAVDAVHCRLRFWARLRAHRTLLKGLRAWAAAAAAAVEPSALSVRMEAIESEMLQWREEARERLRKNKALTRQLREAEQLQELTYGAVVMYQREYQRAMCEREVAEAGRRDGDGDEDDVSDATRGAALPEADEARVLHDIHETEDELELALEEVEEVGSPVSKLSRLSTTTEAAALLHQQREEDWCRLLSDTDTEDRRTTAGELPQGQSLRSLSSLRLLVGETEFGSASDISVSPDKALRGGIQMEDMTDLDADADVEETDLELEDLFTEQEDNDEGVVYSQLDLQRVFFSAVSEESHSLTNNRPKPEPPRKRRSSLVMSQSALSVVSAVSATSVVDEFWADQLTSDFFNDDDDTSSAVNAATTVADEEEFNTTRTPLQPVAAPTDDDPSISADRAPPPFGLKPIVVPGASGMSADVRMQ